MTITTPPYIVPYVWTSSFGKNKGCILYTLSHHLRVMVLENNTLCPSYLSLTGKGNRDVTTIRRSKSACQALPMGSAWSTWNMMALISRRVSLTSCCFNNRKASLIPAELPTLTPWMSAQLQTPRVAEGEQQPIRFWENYWDS
jgi:hypothetical protein